MAFKIVWPERLSVLDIRLLILNHIKDHGEPLRWAITDVTHCSEDASIRHLRIEAMLIIS
tara:strand:+ start:843 stop:1022 length:180 start_codon:yes stop_codon:yes gene_type:complete